MSDSNPLRSVFDRFALDEGNATLMRDGRSLPLTPKALAVLCALARQPGRLVLKSELLDAAWGHQHVSESVLKTVISELRTVLGDDAKQPRFIETASRKGYRFIGAPSSEPSAPPASIGAPTGSAWNPALAPESALIGRQPELRQALACWDRVLRGGRAVMWVTGEAGIGKTTLIDSFVGSASPQRFTRGQCVEQFGPGEPYLPVLDALSSLARDDPALAPLMRTVAPTWLVQLPWLYPQTEREAMHREVAGSHPDRMLREFSELLDRYTSEQPLLLVTEDLHWSDHATVRLMDRFARSRGSARVMWVGSFRPADAIAAEHPLAGIRHELRASRLSEEIALDPFSEREVAAYIARRFSAVDAREQFVRSLHVNTDGLPLFVVNVVDDLVVQGIIVEGQTGGFPLSVTQVPESVAGVIERRIDRLPSDVRELLEAAAACGVEFRAETIAQTLARPPQWVVDRCEPLVKSQYWLRQVGMVRLSDGSLDSRYRFRHALYRQVIYDRIGAHAKAVLHRRLAQALEQSLITGEEVPAAEIAVHYEMGHDPWPAVCHYALAVESALERLAPVEAVQLIDRAMALLPQCPAGEARLEKELALTTRRDTNGALPSGFEAPKAESAFERSRALCELLPQTPESGLAMGSVGWGYYQRGDYVKAQSWATRVLEIASAYDDPVLRACATDLAGSTLGNQGQLLESRRLLEQAMGEADAAYDRFPKGYLQVYDPSVSTRAALVTPLYQLGLVDQARLRLEEALLRAEASGQPLSRMMAYRSAAALEVCLGNREEVARWAKALGPLCQHGMAAAEGPGLWFRGWVQAHAGDPEGGQALIMEGYASRVRLGRLAGITQPLALAAEAMVLAGHWTKAQEHVRKGMKMAERLCEGLYVPDLLLQQARIAMGTADIKQARAALADLLRLAHAQQASGWELTALTAWCEIDGDDAPEMLSKLREARDRFPNQRSSVGRKGASLLGRQMDSAAP